MKCFSKLLTIGMVLTGFTNVVHASPLIETWTTDGGLDAITHGVLYGSTTGTGSIKSDSGLRGRGTVSPIPILTDLSYISKTPPTINTSSGADFLVALLNRTATDAFAISCVETASNGSLVFYGALSDSNFEGSNFGANVLAAAVSGDKSFARTLTAAAAPEPSGLFLLGTGLLGVAGLLFRRSRKLN
jgi:hypothetical protein